MCNQINKCVHNKSLHHLNLEMIFTFICNFFFLFSRTGYIGPVSIYSYFVIGTLINTFLMAPVVLRTYRQEKLEGSYRCASIKRINYLTLLLKTMNICNKNKNSGFNLHVYLSIALTYSIFLQGLWDYV